MKFIDRIETLLEERNEKGTHLADSIGIKNQSFSDWKKRGTIPAADIVLKIADYFNVSIDWLLTGKDKAGITPDESELLCKYNSLQPHNKNAVLTLLNALYDQENN